MNAVDIPAAAAAAVDILAVGVGVEWGETSNPLVPLALLALVLVLVIGWAGGR